MKSLIQSVLIILNTSLLLASVELISYALFSNGIKRELHINEKYLIYDFNDLRDILSKKKQVSDRLYQLAKNLEEWGILKFENLEMLTGEDFPYESKDYERLTRGRENILKGLHELTPNLNYNAELYKTNSNFLIYKALYSTNEFGWRITKNKQLVFDKDVSLLFWGCSFTFGEGLNNEETFPFILSEKAHLKTYNLGVAGSSPSRMLFRFKDKKSYGFDLNDKNSKFAFYMFMNDHYARVIGTPSYFEVDKSYSDPYFYLESGKLKFKRSFSEMPPLKLFLIKLLGKSNFLKLLSLSYPTIGQDELELFSKTIEGLKNEILESNINVKEFFVVIWPGEIYLTNSLKKELSKLGIRTLDYGILNVHELLRGRNVQKYDAHPSALSNDLLAFLLKKDIEEIISTDD